MVKKEDLKRITKEEALDSDSFYALLYNTLYYIRREKSFEVEYNIYSDKDSKEVLATWYEPSFKGMEIFYKDRRTNLKNYS